MNNNRSPPFMNTISPADLSADEMIATGGQDGSVRSVPKTEAAKCGFLHRNASGDPRDGGTTFATRHRWRFAPLLYLPAAFIVVATVPAAADPDAQGQFSQEGSKLVGTFAVDPAYQGWSVALSADGTTAIVGGLADDKLNGAVWIFTRSGSVWTQQGNKLVGTGAVGQAGKGMSVALSADGNTAFVGGPYDNRSTGAAWVFTRSGAVWTQQGSKLVGTGAVESGRQGTSVALSADGTTAVVGGPYDDAFIGAVWVYIVKHGIWTQQGSKLVGTGAVESGRQGASVALSADGNTAVVGAIGDNWYTGGTWVHNRNGDLWTQGSKLVGTGAVGNASQGRSVAVSADGNTVLIGGSADNSSAGAVWVFSRNGTVWTQGSKLVGTGAVGNASQGHSVALSADGNTAIVGGPHDNSYTGAVWIYTRNGETWSQQGNKLVGIGAVRTARQGFSVALSADGNTAIVGGISDHMLSGAAWVFTRNGSMWTQQYLGH